MIVSLCSENLVGKLPLLPNITPKLIGGIVVELPNWVCSPDTQEATHSLDGVKKVAIYCKVQSQKPGNYCLIPEHPKELRVKVLTH